MEHEETNNMFEALVDRTTDYIETRAELIKLKAQKKSAELASSIFATFFVVIILSFFFILLNIGLALWIGSYFERNYFGFFILAGLYLFISLVVFMCRKSFIKEPLANFIIKKIND